MKTYQLYINNQWMDASQDKYIEVINPSTEEVIAKVASASKEDVDAAVQAAKEAFPAWNGLALEERVAYVRKIGQAIEANQDRIMDVITKELGAPRQAQANSQAGRARSEMEATIDGLEAIDFEETIANAEIIKEGMGVVAAITPWNYPLNQIQRKITPALLAGNTVVVKPASDTPLTAVLLAEIIDELDLPKGVFNLITGSGSSVGDHLASHPDVDLISFTGSTQVGQNLYHQAANKIKKLVLELGGKSALIYLEGGDFDLAVNSAVSAISSNAGQACSALTRLLVPQDRLAEFEVAIKEKVESLKVGDPFEEGTDVGPLVSGKQRQTVLDYVAKGVEEGAKLLVGGKAIEGKGYFIQPTVFTEVSNDMTIAQEEIFGPVLSIITYRDVEEAIALANDSEYGLSGAVVGPEEEAVSVARQIRTGNVIVNGAKVDPHAPFGGYKVSGLGREKGQYGIEDYLEIKAIFK
ncbi:aldehyde dehydrogenase family protein [Hutsoniella sourekii]|uniref:aldehyde dehydrogenase family protein n=1 Tax=Hutsoniella sourekii TaxID=87650 RepID=UPI00048A1650|nr:aldehyde dehydrogenase family protein [Hutsoniella sourekii]